MIDAALARRAWRVLEPVHGMIYFAEEARDQYEAIGITHHRMGYFASRSAALGPVPAEVVIATFFNFCPDLVRKSIPAAWAVADPAKILAARLEGADRALRRAFGDRASSSEVAEAADLARRAAEAACEHPEGRPLFAAHASLPWPEDTPHLTLWHAQTLLREFRGDGHVAALLLEGLSGIEALVTHAASGDVPAEALQRSRAWSDDEWGAAVERLRGRGLIERGEGIAFTEAGRAHRQWVEDRTDASSVPAYDAIGEAGCLRLREIGRELSRAVIDAGLLAVDPKQFLDES